MYIMPLPHSQAFSLPVIHLPGALALLRFLSLPLSFPSCPSFYSPLLSSSLLTVRGFPGGSRGKESSAMQETWVRSLGREAPLEMEMATTPVFLPGESHGQRSLEGCSPWGHKGSDMTEQLTHTHTHINS